MLDYRMKTFLELCKTMSYTETALKLNMTQPAVTQQIHYIEKFYGCKLFKYEAKMLSKTQKCVLLEQYANSLWHNEKYFCDIIKNENGFNRTLYIGATKTIGEYIIGEKIVKYLSDDSKNVSLTVENTSCLLKKLESGELDFALIEGYFDKQKYGFKLFRKEPFVGICAKNHKFAGKTVTFEELFSENIIVRETGSGTRNILEQMLKEHNYKLEAFKKIISISNFSVIKQLIRENIGISFVYEAVCKSDTELAAFAVEDVERFHELNCVFLKNAMGQEEFFKFCDNKKLYQKA